MPEVLPAKTLTPELALDALVRANGNTYLAAEKLKISRESLIAAIASDPSVQDRLASQLRVITLINLFELIQQVAISFNTVIDQLTAFEMSKAITQLATVLDLYTKVAPAQQTNINITEYVMKMLPPTAREALISLVESR